MAITWPHSWGSVGKHSLHGSWLASDPNDPCFAWKGPTKKYGIFMFLPCIPLEPSCHQQKTPLECLDSSEKNLQAGAWFDTRCAWCANGPSARFPRRTIRRLATVVCLAYVFQAGDDDGWMMFLLVEGLGAPEFPMRNGVTSWDI